MQINYNRKQAVDSSKLTITGVGNTDDTLNKQFFTTAGAKSKKSDAMFQWSYRDLSTLKSDESNLAALERTDETLLPVGTKVQITVEVVKNGMTYSITKDYTITADDVAKATWTPALISVGSQKVVSIAEKEENDPYPLMKFSYNRLADGTTVELKVTKQGGTTPYFYEGDTFDKANSTASFT